MSGEADQVKWRGVRPIEGIRGIWPDQNATRINKSEALVGAGSQIIYTVPAGKKLFVSTAALCTVLGINVLSGGWLEARDAADVRQYFMMSHALNIAGHMADFVSYLPALELEDGWDVALWTYGGGVEVRGYIFGWLESA